MTIKTWSGLIAGSPASGTTVWSPVGAVVEGDDLVFDGTSVVTCTMDLIVAISSLRVTSSYTGYIQCVSSLTVGSGMWLDGA